MRRLFSIIGIIIFSLCCFCGCSEKIIQEKEPEQTIGETVEETAAEEVVALPPLNIQELSCLNEKGIAPLGTLEKEIKNKRIEADINDLNAYDYNEFINAVAPGMYCYPSVALNSHISTIGQFNKYFPIEYFSVIDEDTLCVVYKLINDEKIIYSYVIFDRFVYEGPASNENTEVWGNSGEFYIYMGDCTYEKFSEIKSNTKLGQHKDILESVVQGSLVHSFNSVIMLNDGVLVLNYSSPKGENIRNAADPEEFVINEISFFSYGKKTDDFVEPERGKILADGFYPKLPDFS